MPKVLNKRNCIIEPNQVYVGRPSKWGNPYIIGVHGDRKEVIRLYKEKLSNGELFSIEEIQRELRGKDLVCWCAPQECHADVLLELANL